jgi:hypothetical protein
MNITATLPSPEKPTKYTSSHRRENSGLHQEYTALVAPEEYRAAHREMRPVVTLRIYFPGTRAYACIWTHGNAPEHSRNGSGMAGGYGYHKSSAAAGEAIRNAGFILSKDIGGVGDGAIREAVLAIAAAIGYPEALLHIAHT